MGLPARAGRHVMPPSTLLKMPFSGVPANSVRGVVARTASAVTQALLGNPTPVFVQCAPASVLV